MAVPWIALTSSAQLQEIKTYSHQHACLIFKHSTRCNISSIAQYRLEDDWDFDPEVMRPYFLDLIQYRTLSNAVAEEFSVYHESPQVLVIRDGECVYEESHLGIRVASLHEALE